MAVVGVKESLKEAVGRATTRSQLLERRGGDAGGDGCARERLTRRDITLIHGHMTLSLPQGVQLHRILCLQVPGDFN